VRVPFSSVLHSNWIFVVRICIATNRCLNALRAKRRRPREVEHLAEPPEPTRRSEPI